MAALTSCLGHYDFGEELESTVVDLGSEVDVDTASCVFKLPFHWAVLGSDTRWGLHRTWTDP